MLIVLVLDVFQPCLLCLVYTFVTVVQLLLIRVRDIDDVAHGLVVNCILAPLDHILHLVLGAQPLGLLQIILEGCLAEIRKDTLHLLGRLVLLAGLNLLLLRHLNLLLALRNQSLELPLQLQLILIFLLAFASV